MTADLVAEAPTHVTLAHELGSAVTLEILAPGVQTTVQDLRGRRGLWGVGVPPSGAFDILALALANLAVGNEI